MAKQAMRSEQPVADDLRQAHAELDRRVKELDRRAILTPAEQQELAVLKRQKLAVKDRLNA